MTIIYGQYNDAARTKIVLGTTYEADPQDRNISYSLKEYTQFASKVTMEVYLLGCTSKSYQ